MCVGVVSILLAQIEFCICFQDIRRLMDAIQQKEQSNWGKNGNIFILSDTWGNDNDFLLKYGDITLGSLSFTFEAEFKVSDVHVSHKFNFKVYSQYQHTNICYQHFSQGLENISKTCEETQEQS